MDVKEAGWLRLVEAGGRGTGGGARLCYVCISHLCKRLHIHNASAQIDRRLWSSAPPQTTTPTHSAAISIETPRLSLALHLPLFQACSHIHDD